MEDTVLVCTDCFEEITNVGEDHLDYCECCESIVEGLGRTKRISRKEFEE